jgi:hypothetical protein
VTLRKAYAIEELPWDLRMALLRFVNAKAGVGEVFIIDTLTLFGKKHAQEALAMHPNDDATGFLGEESTPTASPTGVIPQGGIIPNIDPVRGY